MKAVRFFSAVFFSMLLVFLVATGEVRRWLSKDKGLPTQLEIAQRDNSPRAPKNLIEFPFYDVDQGKLLFVIKAEFSQEEFQGDKKIEDIRELNLKNGVIEVPISDEGAPNVSVEGGPPVEGRGPEERVKSLVLEFMSAYYKRGGRAEALPGDGKRQFEVLLKDGRGTTNEGTEFFFEELVFTNEPAKNGEKSEGAFLLHSAKPASIQSPSFALSSPSGFRGTLRGHGLESFVFLPPIGALIDPNKSSLLNFDAGLAGDPNGKVEDATKSDLGSEKEKLAGKSKIAVRCQGPLRVVFEEKKRDASPPRPPSTFVRFQKDVVLYSVDAQETLASLSAPQGNRFECQFLELELENAGTEFFPRRAMATSSLPARFVTTPGSDGASSVDSTLPSQPPRAGDGGHVKAVLFKESGGPPYTLEGERLEWTLTKPADGSPPAAPRSEAILYGNPTLRGEGMSFNGERAVFHLSENRVVLESVEGSLDYVSAAEKDGRKRKLPGEALMAPTPVENWEDEANSSMPEGSLPGGPNKSGGKPGFRSNKAESGTKPNVPQLWDVKADEVEFFFQSLSGRGGGSERDFSRLVARSVEPDGVVIESRPTKEHGTDSRVQGGFRATGKALSYTEVEKKATLQGTADVKPRFSQGGSWIEAQRIHLLLEERVVWFVDGVKGRIESVKSLSGPGRGKGPITDNTSKTEHGKEAEAQSASEPDTQLDMEAVFLAARFQEDKSVRDLLARGAPEAPVRVTCVSSQKWSFVGSELYWDGERQFAQLVGLSREAAVSFLSSLPDAPGGKAASPFTASVESKGESKPPSGKSGGGESEVARVEFDGGELIAQRIRFHQATWRAFLTDRVTIRTFDKAATAASSQSQPQVDQVSTLEVSTGKAEVEFYPNLKVEGPPREGMFRNLGQIKSFHAQRAPDRPIELRGRSFAGRADEATWDAARRELRFYGNGEQEIEILREDFKGPIRAREIVYDEQKCLATLRGNVHGTLVQSAPAADSGAAAASSSPISRIEPAAHNPTEGAGPMVWQFDTSVLEIQLRQESGAHPDSGSLSFVSLRARDKVLLRNDELGLQLRGDDLIYDNETRKVRVFSPDGRPQTLLCDKLGNLRESKPSVAPETPAGKPAESSSDKLHKIVAQEICLLIYENPYAIPQRGEPKAWLLVEFQRDVIGSFYMPSLRSGKEVEELGDVWKMVAEKLTLLVDPSKPFDPHQDATVRKLIPWAVAKGNVVFSSGSFQATADRAIYEDPTSTLTLIGSPARLSQDNKPRLAEPEILIRKVGAKVGLEYGKPEKPLQLPSVGDLGK